MSSPDQAQDLNPTEPQDLEQAATSQDPAAEQASQEDQERVDHFEPRGDGSDEIAPSATVTRAERKALRAQKRAELQAAKAEKRSAREEARKESQVIRRARREQQLGAMRRGMRSVGSWLASGPVSGILSLVLIALFAVSASMGRADFQADVVAGLGQPWWTIFSSVAWTTSILHLVTDVILLLTVGVFLERMMKSEWYAAAGFASYWLGSLVALAVALGVSRFDHAWGDALHAQFIGGTSVFLVGAALAASVKMETLWRRRIWIVVGTILLVMLTFAGTLNTLAMVSSAIIGLIIGLVLWGKERDRRPAEGSKNEGRTLVALVVGGIVVGIFVSLHSPSMSGALASMRWDFVSTDLPPESVDALCATQGLEGQCAHYRFLQETGGLGSRILAILPLLVQLILAWGLRGGRRAAYWGTLILQGTSGLIATIHLIYVGSLVHNWEGAAQILGFNSLGQPTARFIVPIVVPIVIIVLLIATRKLFTVKAAPGTYQKFWAQMAAITAGTLLVALILTVIFRDQTDWIRDTGFMVLDFFVRLLPSTVLSLVAPQALIDNTAVMRVLEWAPLVPWVALGILLLNSFRRRYLPSSISQERFMEILRATSGGSMAWMGTWNGNNYWASDKYEAAVAYRSDGGVALTVSDPAAKPEDLAAVVKEFTDFAVDQDLIPAFYSVPPPVAEITDSWGWQRLQVAEETILQLPDLAFRGKAFQDVRTALNHGKREGIRPVWTNWEDCPDNYRKQIENISAAWVGDKSLPEMGFTLGGVAELDDPDVRILMAVDEEDQIHGVTSWMPIWDEGDIIGWTLDFMRRKEDGFRPVMEFLIAQAAMWAQEEHYEVLSLSGAPLAKAKPADVDASEDAVEGSSAAFLDVVLSILGKALEPVYGFSSLLRFKAKFKPEYQPVFLTVPDVTTLPTVGLAIAHAYIPDMTARDVIHMAQSMRAGTKGK